MLVLISFIQFMFSDIFQFDDVTLNFFYVIFLFIFMIFKWILKYILTI